MKMKTMLQEKNLEDMEVVISPVGRSVGSNPGCVAALPGLGSGE
jgi:hypothetical protein